MLAVREDLREVHTNGSMLTSHSGQGVGSGLGEDLISKDKEAGAGEVGHWSENLGALAERILDLHQTAHTASNCLTPSSALQGTCTHR